MKCYHRIRQSTNLPISSILSQNIKCLDLTTELCVVLDVRPVSLKAFFCFRMKYTQFTHDGRECLRFSAECISIIFIIVRWTNTQLRCSEFMVTDPKVLGSIPGAAIFSA
jgi:hypothetical protein